MSTIKLTVAQAVIKFLNQQYVARDGIEYKFFAGCFGIFGHGNVAGIGQALQQQNDLKYYQCRNEQAMVHTAAAYAKMKNRLSTFVCTTSIGPRQRVLPSIGCPFYFYLEISLPREMLHLPYNNLNHRLPKIFLSMTASNRYPNIGIASIVPNN